MLTDNLVDICFLHYPCGHWKFLLKDDSQGLDVKVFMGSQFLRGVFISPSLFSVPPPFKVFEASSPHATPSCPNPIDQPSLHIINRFKQISKGRFYHFNCHFLSKVNFLFFLIPFKNILIYWIFSGSFLET